MNVKVGLMLPNSNYINVLGKGLTKALELGLNSETGVDFEIKIEPGGYNADRFMLEDKFNQLLIKEQVDVVVAPANAGVLNKLHGLFSGQQVPLIMNTLGEDLINDEFTNPYIFANTLNLWKSFWLLGNWAAQTYGPVSCSLSALHDGGYGTPLAYALGYEAGNGSIAQVGITHRNAREEDESQLINEIAGNNPDVILGLYSGREAVDFLNQFEQLGHLSKYR